MFRTAFKLTPAERIDATAVALVLAALMLVGFLMSQPAQTDTGRPVDQPTAVSGTAQMVRGYHPFDSLTDLSTAVPEDSDRWSCESMGNRLCGAVSLILQPNGSAVVQDESDFEETAAVLESADVISVSELNMSAADYLDSVDICSGEYQPIATAVVLSELTAVDEGSTRAALVTADGCLLAFATVLLY